MTTYKLQYKLADGRKVIDPTVFKTRKAAQNRIAIMLDKQGITIKCQHTK